MTRLTARLRARRGDAGFAVLVVLGGMIALSLVVLATLTYVVGSLPATRRGQDANAAVQAAQAGIDDYLGRLASCDSYWLDGCDAPANPALTGWAGVPGSSAQYHYEVVSDPAHGGPAGLLRVRATGRIKVAGKSSARTLVVDLSKTTLLNYIYYTDKEAVSPNSVVRRYPPRTQAVNYLGYTLGRFSGVTPGEADHCNRYFYATSTTPARVGPTEQVDLSNDGGATWPRTVTSSVSCDLQFAAIDVLDGPVYTQDAILLDTPLFKGKVSTRWADGSTPAPPATYRYRKASSSSAPQSAGFSPAYDTKDVKLPPSNAAIKDRVNPLIGDGAKGCPFTGPTRIVLKGDGTMDVTSPLTRSTNAPCTRGSASAPGLNTVQNVPLPDNGVIYVSGSTDACPGNGKSLGTYPVDGDVTTYDCAAGDVFVEGTLSGRLTIATEGNIVVTSDVRYANPALDSLGLVSQGEVQVYHPVSCSSPPVAPSTVCGAYANMAGTLPSVEIDAAVFSVAQSFTVQNFDRAPKLGTLKVLGGIYQKFRGPVGSSGGSGSGYAKNYVFDTRLKTLPPPSFLDPVAAPWAQDKLAEVRNPTGLPS